MFFKFGRSLFLCLLLSLEHLHPAFCKAWDLNVFKVVLHTQALTWSHLWAWSLLWGWSMVCIYKKDKHNQLGIMKVTAYLVISKIGQSYKAGVCLCHSYPSLFQERFRNKMTYMAIDQKWVMQSLGEEISISTKAGENNCYFWVWNLYLIFQHFFK